MINFVVDDEDEDSSNSIDNIPGLSLKRTGHVAVNYKNYMIAWGGFKESTSMQSYYFPSEELLIYRPVLEKWSRLCTQTENKPPRLSGSCGLVHDEQLFIFGGYSTELAFDTNKGNTNELYRLDFSSLQWNRYTTCESKPAPCDKMVGWVHENRLYFFGGYGYAARRSSYEVKLCDYCPDADSDGTPPIPRAAHAAAKVGSKVYIFGGRNLNVRMNDLHMLDLETMTWSGSLWTKGSVPQGRSWHSLTAISDDMLVLYGGFSQQQEALNECWILTLTTLTWISVVLPLNRPRLWHTACLGDPGEIIIFGGCVGNVLSPQRPLQVEDIITLWFTPKSLLRLCLDAILQHTDVSKDTWSLLPSPLQEFLLIKSTNTTVQDVASFGK